MTGRERILTALERKQPDKVPTMEWVINPHVIQGITGYTSDVRFICEYDVDGIAVPLQYRHEAIDEDHYIDEWQIVRRSRDEYPTPVKFPIGAPEDLAKYKVPDPDDDYRYTKILQVKEEVGKDKAVVPRVKDVFSMPRDLMGFENFLMSFYLEPGLAQDLIEMSVEHSIRIAKNLKSIGIEVIVIGDDIANNTGLLISPDMYREQVYPSFKKLVGEFKQLGLKVVKHTDGDIRAILPELVASGIDCLDPIDPLGKMDMEYMKRAYGDQVALKGNVDCVHTLVDGTLDEVERDVKKCILQGSFGGGHIISSSNTVHVGIHPQNYKFFLECIRAHGTYPLDSEELKRQ